MTLNDADLEAVEPADGNDGDGKTRREEVGAIIENVSPLTMNRIEIIKNYRAYLWLLDLMIITLTRAFNEKINREGEIIDTIDWIIDPINRDQSDAVSKMTAR